MNRDLWWLAVAVHVANIAIAAWAYHGTKLPICLGIISMSVVLGAYATKHARLPKRPGVRA